MKADGRCACGRLVYNGHTDAQGRPAHPCCVENGPECSACAASDAAERAWQEHGMAWALRVKAFWKAEAERNNPTQEEA